MSGDISHNMAWSMNFNPAVHHDNLPCPMNSQFPFFLFLAFNKRKPTFKIFNGNVNCKSYKELTFSVKLDTKSNSSGLASHVGSATGQTDRLV